MPLPLEQLEEIITYTGPARGEGFKRVDEAIKWLASTDHGAAQIEKASTAGVKQGARQLLEQRKEVLGRNMSISEIKDALPRWREIARDADYHKVSVHVEDGAPLLYQPETRTIVVPADPRQHITHELGADGNTIATTLESNLSHFMENAGQSKLTQAEVEAYQAKLAEVNGHHAERILVDHLDDPKVVAQQVAAEKRIAEAVLNGDRAQTIQVAQEAADNYVRNYGAGLNRATDEVLEIAGTDPTIANYNQRFANRAIAAQNKVLEMQGKPTRALDGLSPGSREESYAANAASLHQVHAAVEAQAAGLVESMEGHARTAGLIGAPPTTDELINMHRAQPNGPASGPLTQRFDEGPGRGYGGAER